MNLQNIIQEIETVDPEVYERLDDRRTAIKQLSRFASKAALATLPLAFGSLLKKSYGQSTTSIVEVLNFALTLEYLEAEFYLKGLQSPGLIPAGVATSSIQTIQTHEQQHVDFLKAAIMGAGGTPVAKPTFDFTAGGTYANVFSNYGTFLAVAQAFEDTGVRAYKGQAGNVMSNKTVLTAALRIHSVEARHASHIRHMRRIQGANVKPWITGNDAGGVPGVAAIYAGEEIITQAGVQITNINGTGISAATASESFDEPLTRQQVLNIVQPFIV